MTTIELTDDEVALVRTALHTYLDDFGHKEMDILRRVQDVIAKLPPENVEPPQAS